MMKAITYQGIKDVKVNNVGNPKLINKDDIIVKVTSTPTPMGKWAVFSATVRPMADMTEARLSI